MLVMPVMMMPAMMAAVSYAQDTGMSGIGTTLARALRPQTRAEEEQKDYRN